MISKLDDYESQLDLLGLIKIDVEGYESGVLKGAELIIKQHKPVIVYEMTKYSREHMQFEYGIFDWLVYEMGYKLFERISSNIIALPYWSKSFTE